MKKSFIVQIRTVLPSLKKKISSDSGGENESNPGHRQTTRLDSTKYT